MNKMPKDSNKPDPSNDQPPAAEVIQGLARSALKGALATISRSNGAPYASLVTCATTHPGNPILLLSQLAVHTQNLNENQHASLLIDGTGTREDALTGNRATLIGRVAPSTDEVIKNRFLARHPSASFYAGFQDFDFYVMEVESAHYIGGFGRIVDVPFSDIAISVKGAASLIEAHDSIVEHMNEEHADSLTLYAQYLLGLSSDLGPWRMSGLDPQGLDIIGSGGVGGRLNFNAPITSPNEARAQLRDLSERARARKANQSG